MLIMENLVNNQMGIVDRISELPGFILHRVISNLDTKEACRVSVLSKKWYEIWSSVPILDFKLRYFKKYDEDENVIRNYDDEYYDNDVIERYLRFIENTMERYFTHKYRITKLCLELPEVDEVLEDLVDEWMEIAVQNQVQELDIDIRYVDVDGLEYGLPEIVFSAKSLKVLKCKNFQLPYYETMELMSLEYLTLVYMSMDEDMVQRMISLCPLVELDIKYGAIEELALSRTGQVSRLTSFVFEDLENYLPWPWTINTGALKNLRKLEICSRAITDAIVSELVQGLVVLESLVLNCPTRCSLLKCINISSISLKEFRVDEMLGLMKTTINAPNLLEFWYNSRMDTSVSLISTSNLCNTQVFPLMEYKSITTSWYINLVKFLVVTNCFNTLVIDLSECTEIDEDVDVLWDVITTPSYKLRELKLLKTSAWCFLESSITAFFDGLFLCCHPDVLSLTAGLESWFVKEILNILNRKVKCWEDPLISIEVEAVDYSSLLSDSSELEIREYPAMMQTVTSDRVSDLPDFILHCILSFLDTKAVGRASVLSKRWYGIWSSNPILDFQLGYFKDGDVSCKYDDTFYDDIIVRYVRFINKTMQRYFTCKYRITKVYLELPNLEKRKQQIDEWIKIAVQNQIQELVIKSRYSDELYYELPEILFRARSLKVLTCENVQLPYYETIDLMSLECLSLQILESIDENMIRKIIAFCPLVNLELIIFGLENIAFPLMRKVNEGAKCFGRGTMQSNFKALPLTEFFYTEFGSVLSWPWNIYVTALTNLRKLEIFSDALRDDDVYELVLGLVALQSLVLSCSMLKCLKISSVSLKDLRIRESLESAMIDAPNMLEFWYEGDVMTSEKTSLSLIRAEDRCYAYYSPAAFENITADWFVKLNKFLIKTDLFKSLVINLSGDHQLIEEVDLLRNVVISPPYKLSELKLVGTSEWKFSNYLFKAVIDVLFWCCQPDVLSITANFENWNNKAILDILTCKVKCWKHPLKSIEVEAVDYSRLLSESSELEIRFRLSWS